MPKKNWTLEYCAFDNVSRPAPAAHSIQIQLEASLVPPAPLEKFDFQRPPLAKDSVFQMIILQGVIGEDGTVSDLKVFKGVDEIADQAAVAAFARWKFAPARRENNPVAIEVLVGIPAVVPGS